jgi:peptidoglycan/xylan/chitin deacetylase (PgdA/CDA1 family)
MNHRLALRFRHLACHRLVRVSVAIGLATSVMLGLSADTDDGQPAAAAMTTTERPLTGPPSRSALRSPAEAPDLPLSPLVSKVWSAPGVDVARGAPVVALTFDDGPDPRWTPMILASLAQYGVHATFFMVGARAAKHPDLVRAVIAQGSTVGGHTWDHRDLRGLSDDVFAHEVDDTDAFLSAISGTAVTCVRPPNGAFDAEVRVRLVARGDATALWSVDTDDWRRPGAIAIAERALANVRAGSIVLLHDGGGDRSETVAALPAILDGLRSRGLIPVPICGPGQNTGGGRR